MIDSFYKTLCNKSEKSATEKHKTNFYLSWCFLTNFEVFHQGNCGNGRKGISIQTKLKLHLVMTRMLPFANSKNFAVLNTLHMIEKNLLYPRLMICGMLQDV